MEGKYLQRVGWGGFCEDRLWEDKTKGRIKRQNKTKLTMVTTERDTREASGVPVMFDILIWAMITWLCSLCENSLSCTLKINVCTFLYICHN